MVPEPKRSKERGVLKAISENNFSIGAIVWCKLKGYRHWPAKVLGFDQNKIIVRWFNDNRRQSTVFASQIQQFSRHCFAYSQNVSISLATAIKEALIEYRNKMVYGYGLHK